jgi:hypothetical protein
MDPSNIHFTDVRLIILFSVLLGAVGVMSCRESRDEWYPIVPAGQGTLVVVFIEDVTQKEINRFYEQHVIDGPLQTQHSLRDGIVGTRGTRVGNHKAYILAIDKALSPERRAAMRQDMLASPDVHDVFEDLAPEDIDLSNDSSPPAP